MAITRGATSSLLQGLPKYRSMLGGNSPYAPPSFESIATITPSGVSTITFSGIPSGYQSLQIRAIGRRNSATTAGSANLRFNLDTSATYSKHHINGNGSSVTMSSAINTNQIEFFEYSGGDASVNNIVGAVVCDVLDYASTTKFKTITAFNGVDFNTSGNVYLFSGLWRSSAAINSLTIFTSANYLTTTFALYGVK